MNCNENQEIVQFLHEICPKARVFFMKPSDAIFEENVKMNCFYCGRYNQNWRCPPRLPDIDFPKMFMEFDFGMFVVLDYTIDATIYQEIRNESSIVLHKVLLQIEKWLLSHNKPTALSFIGGGCKLCRDGCGKERCNNPYLSRSPLEATGCNVIKTARKYGIDIRFPAHTHLVRIGLVLWQSEE